MSSEIRLRVSGGSVRVALPGKYAGMKLSLLVHNGEIRLTPSPDGMTVHQAAKCRTRSYVRFPASVNPGALWEGLFISCKDNWGQHGISIRVNCGDVASRNAKLKAALNAVNQKAAVMFGKKKVEVKK